MDERAPDASALGARLRDFLAAPIDSLRVLASGWETIVFEFALAAPSPRIPGVPAGAPLVLRLYDAGRGDDKGPREYAAMRAVAAAKLPVPAAHLFEPSREALGAPFLIMQRLDGGPMFATSSFPSAFMTFTLGFTGFVRTHAALHKIDPGIATLRSIKPAFITDTIASGSPLLDRILSVVGERIEKGPLPGLREAHRSLVARATAYRDARPSIVHMDYHPQNVLVRGPRISGVIDWVSADIGDRHLDIATTAVILATSTMEHPRWMRANVVGNSLRRLYNSLYLGLHHAVAPLDFDRLRYCQAVAAVLRLSMFGTMRSRGAAAAGFRPDSIAQVTPSVVAALSAYAARKTAIPVSI